MDEDRGAATVLTDRALLPLVDASALDHAVRLAVGVTGQSDAGRYGHAAGERGRWAILALSGLAFACSLPALLVLLLSPVVGPELGSSVARARWGVVGAEVVVVVSALLAVVLIRSGRRHGVAVAAAINSGVVAVVVSRLDAVPVMIALFAVGAALASIGLVVLRPLLVDVAPPEVRVRALARWRGATVMGAAGAAALAALALGGPEWGWRTALTAAGAIAVVLGLLAVLVDDPGVGGFELRRLAKLAQESPSPLAAEEKVTGSLRRVVRRRVVVAALPGYLGIGLAGLASMGATASVVQSLGLTAPETYLGLAAAWAVAAVLVLVVARLLEALRRFSPARLAVAAPVLLLVAAGGLVAVGLSSGAGGALAGTAAVAAGATLAAAALDSTVLSGTPPPDRPAASALTAVAIALGAITGQVWLAVPDHHDVTGSLVAWLAAPVAVVALLLLWLPRAAAGALDDLVAEVSARAGDRAAADERLYGGRHRAGAAVDADQDRAAPEADESGTVVVDSREPPVPETPAPPVPQVVTPVVEAAAEDAAEEQAVPDAVDRPDQVELPEPEPVIELTVRLVPTTAVRGGAGDADGTALSRPSEAGARRAAPRDRPAVHGVSILDARAVTVAYGSLQVVVDVDLRLEAGETVALIGPSGVGRAALLRVLAGAGAPSSGEVLLDGEDVSLPPVFPRAPLDLAEIVRGRPLLGSMTVAENLRMYGFTVGHDKAEVDARTAVAYEVYPHLQDRHDQLASTLSGADRQRVALARSLMAAPTVLLVEPESLWLRPVVAAELAAVLGRLRAGGTGLLLVAESSEALPMPVDRAYLLARGRVTEQRLPPAST